MTLKARIAAISSVTLVVAAAVAFYIAFYFPYSEGWEAGTVNYFKREGFVFKTYEGKLIQEGIKGSAAGKLSSNEFKFSVEDEAIADSLSHCAGKKVELSYKQYLHGIWWRGDSRYVVNGIR